MAAGTYTVTVTRDSAAALNPTFGTPTAAADGYATLAADGTTVLGVSGSKTAGKTVGLCAWACGLIINGRPEVPLPLQKG